MTETAMQLPEWLTAAASYRSRGWANTLPLPVGLKYPPPGGFTGYEGADVADTDLASWAAQGGYGNLALRLPDGVIGLDVDSYEGKDGRATIARLERKWGTLPHTWRITSRWPDDDVSGIRLYRVPPGMSWNNPGPGVEAIHRAWRYAVCWPSRHPSGRLYCAVDESTGEVVASALPVTPGDLPALPQAWRDGLLAGEATARVKGDAGDLPDEWATTGTCLRVSRSLATALDALDNPSGNESRHDVTRNVMLALIGYGARGHGGVGPALSYLHGRFMDAIGDTRGRRSAAGEWERMLHQGVAIVRGEQRAPEHCHGADGEPGKVREVPDWLAELSAAQAPAAAPSVEAPEGVDPQVYQEAWRQWVEQRLPVLDWRALWDDDSEQEWIVEPLLPARRLVALYSAPKVGKSLLLLEVAAAVSCGREVLGYVPKKPYVTLYVDYENDPRGDIRERLQGMGYEPENLGNLRYLSFPTMAALDGEQGSQELMAAVRYHGAELVVIDTVSRSVAGDENENDTWLSFYRHTGIKLKQAGVSLIRLDHSGKDETKGQRGGSAKVGDVDAVWRMSKVADEVFTLECEANRFPLVEKLLTLRRVEDPDLRHKVDAKGNIAAWNAQLDEWERTMREAGVLDMGEKAAYDRMKELRAAGRLDTVVPKNKIGHVKKRLAAAPKPFEWEG